MFIFAQRIFYIARETTVTTTLLLISSVFLALSAPAFAEDTPEDKALRLALGAIEDLRQKTAALAKAIDTLKEENNLLRAGLVPVGAIVYFRSHKCPDPTWRPMENARGRYIVSLTQDGVPGATIGKPLSNQESRTVGRHEHASTAINNHTHSLAESGLHTHTSPYENDTNGRTTYEEGNMRRGQETTLLRPSGTHRHDIGNAGAHRHTIEPAGVIEGTNAPYIQFLACEKIR